MGHFLQLSCHTWTVWTSQSMVRLETLVFAYNTKLVFPKSGEILGARDMSPQCKTKEIKLDFWQTIPLNS